MASLQHRFAGGSRGLAATDGSGIIAVPDRLDQNAGCRLAAVASTWSSRVGSIDTRWSSPTVAENRPLFVEPRIVPPWVRTPAMFRASSGK